MVLDNVVVFGNYSDQPFKLSSQFAPQARDQLPEITFTHAETRGEVRRLDVGESSGAPACPLSSVKLRQKCSNKLHGSSLYRYFAGEYGVVLHFGEDKGDRARKGCKWGSFEALACTAAGGSLST